MMVSIYRIIDFSSKYLFELVGLSTDEKPIGKYDNQPIKNGSLFFEMDTSNSFLYDEENSIWRSM